MSSSALASHLEAPSIGVPHIAPRARRGGFEPRPIRPSLRYAFAAVAVLFAIGCGARVVQGIDPHPTPLVPQGRYALELSDGVVDTQTVHNLRVTDVRSMLSRGFHNAFGNRATTQRSDDPLVLVIDEYAFEVETMGYVRVLRARVRGRWMTADGHELTSFAGRAAPRNALANGREQIEDLVEVTYEELVSDFQELAQQAAQRASSAGGEDAPQGGIR